MNPLLPPNKDEFRTACARVRNLPEFQLVLAYLKHRYDAHLAQLVSATPADVPQFQGRAKEILDILSEIEKTKE